MNKLKVALKDLRDTEVWLKIIVEAKLIQPIIKLLQSSLLYVPTRRRDKWILVIYMHWRI